VLSQSVKDFMTDNGPQWAATLAYYTLLSVFPLLLAAAAIAAFIVDPKWAVNQVTHLLGNFLPTGQGQINSVVKDAIDARANAGLVSVILLAWTGSRVFGTLTQALNIAYDVDESYSFLKRTVIQFAMALTIGLLFVVAIASLWLIGFVGNLFGITGPLALLIRILRWLVPGLLLWLALALTYRYVPRARGYACRSDRFSGSGRRFHGCTAAVHVLHHSLRQLQRYLRSFGDRHRPAALGLDRRSNRSLWRRADVTH
jgi:membrane protein